MDAGVKCQEGCDASMDMAGEIGDWIGVHLAWTCPVCGATFEVMSPAYRFWLGYKAFKGVSNEESQNQSAEADG